VFYRCSVIVLLPSFVVDYLDGYSGICFNGFKQSSAEIGEFSASGSLYSGVSGYGPGQQ